MQEHKIREILRKLGKTDIRKSGDWLNCACPLAPWTHPKGTDSNPSFGVIIDTTGRSSFNCYSCKHTGQLSDLIRKIEYFSDESLGSLAFDADMADLMQDIPDFVETREEKLMLSEPLDKEVYYDIYPKVKESTTALQYLSKRGISSKTAEKLDLFFDPNQNRVLFPILDSDGKFYGFSGRSVLDSKAYPKIRNYLGLQKKELLLGEDKVNPELPLLVVEGLFAYASLIEEGVDELCSVVALLGSDLSDEQAMKLVLLGRPTYLLLDDDEAGDAGLFGLYDPKKGKHCGGGAISKLKNELIVFVPEYPEGKIDPDELTYEEVKNILETSKPYVDCT